MMRDACCVLRAERAVCAMRAVCVCEFLLESRPDIRNAPREIGRCVLSAYSSEGDHKIRSDRLQLGSMCIELLMSPQEIKNMMIGCMHPC